MIDPFVIKTDAHIQENSARRHHGFDVDGDIVVSDYYRKHARRHAVNSGKSKMIAYGTLLLFLLLTGKLGHLQIVRGAEFYGAAEGNRIREIPVIPTRGVIFDATGERLAYNVPDFALFVIPADLPKEQNEEDAMFADIGAIINIDPYDIVEQFARIPRNSTVQIEIARGLTQEQAVQINQRISEWRGVMLSPIQKRAYAVTESFSHVFGYTGKQSSADYESLREKGYLLSESTGKAGLERVYQDFLRGTLGKNIVEVDSFGRETRRLRTTEPLPGENMWLTINARLQEFIYAELQKTAEEQEAPAGSVVVLDPRTGAVRALVSYPGYDNSAFVNGISPEYYEALLNNPTRPLFNRSISGEYPSGSTFKMVVAAGALEEGLITARTTVQSTGGINVNGYVFPDWKYGGHGQTNIVKALAESVNTFFYAIGGGHEDITGLGVDRIRSYGARFGLSKPTGIDLPSERAGFLPTKEWKEEVKGERWFLGDTYHLAIGQGDILVTPIQIANMTAVFANGGTLYQPQLVGKIGATEDTARAIEPHVITQQVVSPATVSTIREGLRAAVTSGSARSLLTLPVTSAGKTGTAEFSSIKEPHAWFTGFAPYDNAELVVTVLIEEGEGGTVSATPLAKKIFEWWFNPEQHDTGVPY